MDEALELLDGIADAGAEGIVTWLLRLVGLVAVLAGTGLWLFTEMTLVVPAVLIVGGLVLLIVPGILLSLAEVVE